MYDEPIIQKEAKPLSRVKPNSLRNHSIASNEQQSITLEEAFRKFLLVKDIEGLRERTLKDHVTHFTYFLYFLDRKEKDINYLHEVTTNLCREYISFMKNDKVKWDNHGVLYDKSTTKGLSPVTINIRIRTLKAQFKFYVQEGYLSMNPWDRVPLLKTDKGKIHALSKEEILKLLRVPDKSAFAGYRNYTLISTLLDTGCRISELLAVNEWDLDLDNGIIYVEGENSKPRSGRPVPVSTKTSVLIKELLKHNSILEDREPAIFITVSGKRLLDSDVRRILKDYSKKAVIKNVRVSPHVMRHTFAKHYILNGGDPFTLQNILGHSTMEMTRKYILMKIDDLKKQHERFSPLNY
jgi:integrase/recombinase XerD